MAMDAQRQSEIVRALPFARRYARALTGSQGRGDALVAQALKEGVPADLPAALRSTPRSAARADSATHAIPQRQRQLLLLTALEDLPLGDAALAVGLSPADARRELAWRTTRSARSRRPTFW
jgi:DNA-directed RNA polymerase specialized sigma24 family protein